MTLAAMANMANVRTMKIASRTEIITIRHTRIGSKPQARQRGDAPLSLGQAFRRESVPRPSRWYLGS
jgi:hypothetical protein